MDRVFSARNRDLSARTLTEQERIERELLRRYHEKQDLQARSELTERLMPAVRSVARRYASTPEHLEDVVQVGAIGLLHAIDRSDLSLRTRFISFAMPTITGEIKRYFRDTGWDVHVPRGMQELQARVNLTR